MATEGGVGGDVCEREGRRGGCLGGEGKREQEGGREGKGREGKGREGKGREGKGREGKGREGKGREGKGREGKGGREGGVGVRLCVHVWRRGGREGVSVVVVGGVGRNRCVYVITCMFLCTFWISSWCVPESSTLVPVSCQM